MIIIQSVLHYILIVLALSIHHFSLILNLSAKLISLLFLILCLLSGLFNFGLDLFVFSIQFFKLPSELCIFRQEILESLRLLVR